MVRRSPVDKEFFLQDWFVEQLLGAGYALRAQGRNSTPDYLVARRQVIEGYELKALANVRSGRDPRYPPCRTDVDFNSRIPCGRLVKKPNHLLPDGLAVTDNSILRCYYLFTLYEPVDDLHVQGVAFVLVDGDYLNNDLELAEGHLNISERNFGSYGDAFVRIRKMYRFPNPLTEPDFRYRTVFVTQDAALDQNDELRLVSLKRKIEVKTDIVRTFYIYEAV
ncbi:MAG: hypothetical protein L0322_19705 [Chloroflexi bacterium]|nr:hypothetical protein [Chloroflexota bacterium]